MKAAVAVLVLLVAACLAAPLYASLVSGTDPFRTNPLGQVEVGGRSQAVLAEGPEGLGTVPVGPGLRGPYLLGADSLGRDVAARVLYGGRTSLLVAGGATLLCLVLGGVAGVLAGGVGGWVDGVLSGVLDLLWAFPVTLLAISLAFVLVGAPLQLGPFALAGDSPVLTVLVLGLVYTPYVARPVRAELAALRAAPMIEAARAVGGAPGHVLRRHMLPQLGPLLAGLGPVVAATMLLTEAALSVLGLGVQAPGASWGTLIADGQALLHQRPMVAVAPGLAVVATVLALNALGEGLGRRRE